MLRPGDVVLIPFPFSDLRTTKRRPVLVVGLCDKFGDFLAVAITSQPGHDDGILLSTQDFEYGTLPKTSWVRSSKLYTLNQECIATSFGTIKPTSLDKILAAICCTLNC